MIWIPGSASRGEANGSWDPVPSPLVSCGTAIAGNGPHCYRRIYGSDFLRKHSSTGPCLVTLLYAFPASCQSPRLSRFRRNTKSFSPYECDSKMEGLQVGQTFFCHTLRPSGPSLDTRKVSPARQLVRQNHRQVRACCRPNKFPL